MISNFWLTVLEVLYLPIYQFFGYNSIITFIILLFFVMFQLWLFWHLFLKPFVYIFKVFIDFINQNLLWKQGVEVDEKKRTKKNHN
jgi:hypothetical protein